MLNRARRTDDRGSMPLAMLFTVVSLGLSVVLASVLTAEQSNTNRDAGRSSAVTAAQSGIDVALSAIRLAVRDAAVGANSGGDPRALPCDTPGPKTFGTLTGAVGAGSTAAYRVQLYYATTLPVAGTLPASPWTCGSAATGMPSHALIVSAGTLGRNTRTLTATYAFTSVTQNEKVPGGRIQSFGFKGTQDWCFAAPSDTPLNAQLRIELCNGSTRQQFAYTPGLTLQLTRITQNNQRLCLDAGSMAVNNPITFQPCATTPVPRQVWGSDDATSFYVMPNASTRRCMEASAELAPATVRLVAMKSATYCTVPDSWMETMTFLTDSPTGGGRSGPSTDQLVNYAQFGRCIDVTSDDVSSEYLISFPCKQQLVGEVLWNQRWTVPKIPAGEDFAEGPIYTEPTGPSGPKYCLRSPGTTVRPSYYVTVSTCNPASPGANQRWRMWSDTGNKDSSYRIESLHTANACLAVTDPKAPSADLWNETYNFDVSKLVLATCSGSELQKWNASSFSTASAVKDVTEK